MLSSVNRGPYRNSAGGRGFDSGFLSGLHIKLLHHGWLFQNLASPVLSCPGVHNIFSARLLQQCAADSRAQWLTTTPGIFLGTKIPPRRNLPVKSFPSPPQMAKFWQVADGGFLVSSTVMSPQQLLYHLVSHIMPYSTRSGSQPKMGEKSLT